MTNFTTLETKFLEAASQEAYGGFLFVDDINRDDIEPAQKSGIVSSLVQKGVAIVAEGMIAFWDADEGDFSYEVTKDLVKRYLAS
jgi:ribonucleotide monophosphatase NagD (HAD superfamily)